MNNAAKTNTATISSEVKARVYRDTFQPGTSEWINAHHAYAEACKAAPVAPSQHLSRRHLHPVDNSYQRVVKGAAPRVGWF